MKKVEERDSQGNIIGIQSFRVDKDDPKTAYLQDLYVEETHRNQGIGKRLMKAAENIAKSLGLIKSKIEVDSTNPAINMYLKRGYREVGRKKAKNGKTYIVFEKNLTSDND